MSLVLDLPPELESDLAAEAAHLGLPLSEYVLRLLAGGRSPRPVPRTGAELLAYWQAEGLIGTRPDITDAQRMPALCGSNRKGGRGRKRWTLWIPIR